MNNTHIVYFDGKKHWHRTLKGARARAIDAQRWCHNVQIYDIEKNKMVAGRPE